MTLQHNISEIKLLYNGLLFKINNDWYCYGSNDSGSFGIGYYAPKLYR